MLVTTGGSMSQDGCPNYFLVSQLTVEEIVFGSMGFKSWELPYWLTILAHCAGTWLGLPEEIYDIGTDEELEVCEKGCKRRTGLSPQQPLTFTRIIYLSG